MAGRSLLKLCTGRDGTPVPLDGIAAPLLVDYAVKESVLTEWHDFITRKLDGNRNWVEIGLPYVRWTFSRLSRAEYALLMSFSGDVTIVTLDQTGNAYHSYNGKWKKAEANSNDAHWAADAIGGWNDVAFDTYDLELIS